MKKSSIYTMGLLLSLTGMACHKDDQSEKKDESKQEQSKQDPATDIPVVSDFTCPENDYYGCVTNKDGIMAVLACEENKITEKTICANDQECVKETDSGITLASCVDKMTTDVAKNCADKTADDYYCVTVNNASWALYCAGGEAIKSSSTNCSAKGLSCGLLELDGGKVNDCICTNNDQCKTTIANARGACIDNQCTWKCDNGFHSVYDGNSDYCAEDPKFPEAVNAACNNKEDDTTICVTAGTDSWSVYCSEGTADIEFTDNCTALGKKCGLQTINDEDYYDCVECLDANDCPADIENGHSVCNKGLCEIECNSDADYSEELEACLK